MLGRGAALSLIVCALAAPVVFAPQAEALLSQDSDSSPPWITVPLGSDTPSGQFPNLCGTANMYSALSRDELAQPDVECGSNATLGSFDVPPGVSDVFITAASTGGEVQLERHVSPGDGFTFNAGQRAVGSRGGYPDGGDGGSVDARGGDGATAIDAPGGSLLMLAPGAGGAGAPISGPAYNCLDGSGHTIAGCVSDSHTCGGSVRAAHDPENPNPAGDSVFIGTCGPLTTGGDNGTFSLQGRNPKADGVSLATVIAACDGTSGSAGTPYGQGGKGGQCYDHFGFHSNDVAGGGGGGGGIVGGGGGAGGGEVLLHCSGTTSNNDLEAYLTFSTTSDSANPCPDYTSAQGGTGGDGTAVVPAGGVFKPVWDTRSVHFEADFVMPISVQRPNQPLPQATVGHPYGPVQLTATTTPAGLPLYWDADGLPPGITLSPKGVLSGTPTAPFTGTVKIEAVVARRDTICSCLEIVGDTAAVSTQTFIASCNAGGFDQGDPFLNQAYWTVATPDPTKFTVPPSGWVGVPYSYQYKASGSPAGDHYQYFVSKGWLPAGLYLDSKTGVVSGIPLAPTTWSNTSGVTVTAVDDNGCSVSTSRPWEISVLPQPVAGQPYTGSFLLLSDFDSSFDGSVSFNFGSGLPPGIGPSSSDPGANHGLTGTPTTVGNYTYKVTESYGVAQDGSRPDPNVWFDTMPVLAQPVPPAPPPVTFTSQAPPPGSVVRTITKASADGPRSIHAQAASSPAYVYHYSATGDTGIHYALVNGALPPGLTLSSDGTLSGNPTRAGSYWFSVAAIGDHTTEDSSDRIDITSTPDGGFTATLTRGDGTGAVRTVLVPIEPGVAKLIVTVPAASVAVRQRCRKGTARIKGRCRPRETVIARASATGTPGVPLVLVAKPRGAALKRLKRGGTLHADATLVYIHNGKRSQPTVTRVTLKMKKNAKPPHKN